ncbi:MAG: thiamine pyrophosphate-binding protein [Deltaproteobacteria bacterium]|nr:thiamine pyrophosphate-binding protein [Deltaproteobacteria bacterium]
MATGAELVVECLKAEGVRYLFGVTGSSFLTILDVLYRTPEIQYVMSQHEQGASYMAGGYARSTGKPGVVIVHHGVGLTNAFTGVVGAFYSSTPYIMLSPESSTLEYGRGASNRHEMDQVAVMKPVTKLAERVERVERIPEMMQRAFRAATTGRPGPVYVGLARDVLRGKADVAVLPPERYRPIVPLRGNPQEINRALDMLIKAQRPVILAGGGINVAQANAELLKLAELLCAPVAGTADCKGVIPEDHPLALGVAGYQGREYCLETLQQADVILAIGCTFSANTTAEYTEKVLSKQAKIIQVDIDPFEIGKNWPVDVGIVGDAKAVLQDMILMVEVEARQAARRSLEQDGRIKGIRRLKEEWAESFRQQASSDKVPIQRFRLLADLRKALPRDAVVGAESGGTHQWFQFAFDALVPPAYLGGWHSLGSEYCEALGAQLALPDKQVVCITGDGSMMMCLQELATAALYDIKALCVVCVNGSFGNIRHSQLTRYKGRIIGTDLPIPNLTIFAKEFGLYAERVEEPKDIVPAVGRALSSGKPSLLEVIIDTDLENLRPQCPLDLEREH